MLATLRITLTSGNSVATISGLPSVDGVIDDDDSWDRLRKCSSSDAKHRRSRSSVFQLTTIIEQAAASTVIPQDDNTKRVVRGINAPRH